MTFLRKKQHAVTNVKLLDAPPHTHTHTHTHRGIILHINTCGVIFMQCMRSMNMYAVIKSWRGCGEFYELRRSRDHLALALPPLCLIAAECQLALHTGVPWPLNPVPTPWPSYWHRCTPAAGLFPHPLTFRWLLLNICSCQVAMDQGWLPAREVPHDALPDDRRQCLHTDLTNSPQDAIISDVPAATPRPFTFGSLCFQRKLRGEKMMTFTSWPWLIHQRLWISHLKW